MGPAKRVLQSFALNRPGYPVTPTAEATRFRRRRASRAEGDYPGRATPPVRNHADSLGVAGIRVTTGVALGASVPVRSPAHPHVPDVVSKNGNLRINVGPRADETIPELQRDPLEMLGAWLDAHTRAVLCPGVGRCRRCRRPRP